MNKVILSGRICSDIELKKSPSDVSVCSFRIAVSRRFKNAEGNYDADFINCVAFEQRAETISRYVNKGDKFGVEGKINTRTYDKQDGSKVYVTEVIVDGFEFLEGKKDKPTVDVEVEGFEPCDLDLPF